MSLIFMYFQNVFRNQKAVYKIKALETSLKIQYISIQKYRFIFRK